MRVQSGDIELEVEEFDGGGPPILLVMGLGSQMLLWHDDFCTKLADAGHRVVRFDNRDVGLSTRLDHLGMPNVIGSIARAQLGLPLRPPYTLADMASDAAAVLDGLDIERACFVGASMGGMVIQRAAIDHPGRIAGMVSVMSTPHLPRPRPKALHALLKSPAPGRDGYIDHFAFTFRVIGSQTHPAPDEHMRALAARLWERNPAPGGFVRQLVAILADPPRDAALAACGIPTLVIHGAQDSLIPLEHGIETARLLDARLEVHPDMGHDMPRHLWDDLVASISRHATEHA